MLSILENILVWSQIGNMVSALFPLQFLMLFGKSGPKSPQALLTLELFIPLQQDHDYGWSANSCTVIKTAYKVKKRLERGREILVDSWNGHKVIFVIFVSLNALYILWNRTSTARYLMSWYFSVGIPFWTFPLVTQQICDSYMFFQTCTPNWSWHFLQTMKVRGKKDIQNLMIVFDTQPLTFLFFPPKPLCWAFSMLLN